MVPGIREAILRTNFFNFAIALCLTVPWRAFWRVEWRKL
jgi:hypothetical protein